MEWKENLKLMNKYTKYYFLFLLFGLLLQPMANLSANDETRLYKTEKINKQNFDTKIWKEEVSQLKYPKKKKVEKIEKKKNENLTNRTTRSTNPDINFDFNLEKLLKGGLWFFVITLLLYVLINYIGGTKILYNANVRRKLPVALEDIETNLVAVDVESFLKQALKENDYRLAIRLYYLAIIKRLALNGAIVWKRDKTNGHYMRELRRAKHTKLQEFRNVTRIFEYVCYSDILFDKGKFEEVRIDFRNLLTALK